MPTSTSSATAGPSSAGRRKGPLSPNSLSQSTTLPSVPRIKLSVRNTPPVQPQASGSGSGSGPTDLPLKRKVGRPRKSDLPILHHQISQQPSRKASSRVKNKYKDSIDDDDSSDLTPPEDGDDSDIDVTPRKRPVGRPKSTDKGKGKATVVRKKARTTGVNAPIPQPQESASKVTVSGPAGRQRRKAMKIEDAGRRRARDAKFDVTEDAFAGSIPAQGAFHIRSFLDSDTASSFGDDESDHNMSPAIDGMIHESDDDETRGLPEAFAGQEIEDLAYGAPPAEVELEREALAGWFEEEDEEMLISHLSGSEMDQQSQSSAHDSAGQSELDSSSSESETEDQVDEFGFRIPLSNPHLAEVEDEAQPGLVLMENWDGKLVLYQTAAPRPSKNRTRSGSRGSRTNGSVAGSTAAPSASDQLELGDRERDLHLMIDPEAAEYDEDATSSEEWSGESDEMDGDTTDSMDEEDMPMLDSPAMQELIDQQTRLASPSAADGLIGEPLVEPGAGMGAPSIIVTDTETIMAETPVEIPITLPISTLPTIPISPTPQTPTTVQPIMGTFLPTSTDPAQHAVIDGSGTSTKSPFTHRRRSRKNRADSVSSGGARSSRSMLSMSTVDRERKRKSNSVLSGASGDPFGSSPSIVRSISKKARYTSIPGHPKYVQAQQRIEEDDEGTSTEEEEEGGEFDLEDMLDPAVLQQLAQTAGGSAAGHGAEEHMRHLIRFDRVPVSAYIRRNFGAAGSREIREAPLVGRR